MTQDTNITPKLDGIDDMSALDMTFSGFTMELVSAGEAVASAAQAAVDKVNNTVQALGGFKQAATQYDAKEAVAMDNSLSGELSSQAIGKANAGELGIV